MLLHKNQIPWDQCVSFSVDNASVNMDKRNAIKCRVHEKTPDVHFVGFPCHMAHKYG